MGILLSLLKSYWPQIFAFVGAVSLGAGVAWNLQGMRLDSLEIEFGQYRNDVAQNAIAAKRAAMDRENFWRMEIENARINAQSREATIKRSADAAQSAVSGLRNDLGSLQARLATSTDETVLNAAASIGALFVRCADEYRAMAEVADRHASDVQTLTEAWPK